jgi:hypothetical protein
MIMLFSFAAYSAMAQTEHEMATKGDNIIIITKMVVHCIVFRNDIIMEITDYYFASQMPGVVQGYQALEDEIKSGKLTFRGMESIASRYEEWRKSETTK